MTDVKGVGRRRTQFLEDLRKVKDLGAKRKELKIENNVEKTVYQLKIRHK